MKNRMFAKVAILAFASPLAINASLAGEAEDALIAKIVEAYGGERLTNLESIRFSDQLKNVGLGQGWSADYVELTEARQEVQIDLEDNRFHGEFFSDSPTGGFHTVALAEQDDITAINYQTSTYGPAPAPDFYTAIGATVRTSDTLLAYELSARSETATHQGDAVVFGQPHEVISFDYPNSPPLTLYVDSETGFIRKMTRETQFGNLTYQFPQQVQQNGIAFAPGFDFYAGDDPVSITLKRTVEFNTVRDNNFHLDRSLTEAPETIDTSELSIKEIADGLHLVGSGPGFSIFAETDDGVIAAGGYGGLTDRFNAYREAAGHEKPLIHQIVTHHHTDHLAGMAEAFALGATFVSPESAVSNLNDAAGDIPEERLQVVDSTSTVGPFEIFIVSTTHVAELALVYHAPSKTIFQADHYNSNWVDGFAPGSRHTASLRRAIAALDLDVSTVLSAHGPVAVPWSEFVEIADNVNTDPCPTDRAICQ